MKLTLNAKLLGVLHAMQTKRSLLITEAELGLVEDWSKSLNDYYKGLPSELVEGLGLKRNRHCYRAIECFDVPQEWLEAKQDMLGQFSFAYPG
ncbi:MAG: hypothetical protein C9356_11925 [Oleiphilus sp.]|nr:MAG: hypothetical protein C9356_11925 [Oleiphilus sp.]